MTVASFLTGSYLTILIPVCLLIVVLIWWTLRDAPARRALAAA